MDFQYSFEEVAKSIMFSTLESVVRDHRRSLDNKIEINSWLDFVNLAPENRHSSNIYLDTLKADNIEVAIIFGGPESYFNLQTAKHLNFQFLHDVTSEFNSQACCISIIDEDGVSKIIINRN